MAKKKKEKIPPWLVMGAVGLIGWWLTREKSPKPFTGTYPNLEKYLAMSNVTNSYTATQEHISEQFDPPAEIFENADFIAKTFLNPLIEKYGVYDPVTETGVQTDSWYRSPRLNVEVGGAEGSFHLLAFAVDVDLYINGYLQNDLVLDFIVDENIPFTEIALEYGSISNPNEIHYAYVPGRNEKEVIRITQTEHYANSYSWLTDRFGS